MGGGARPTGILALITLNTMHTVPSTQLKTKSAPSDRIVSRRHSLRQLKLWTAEVSQVKDIVRVAFSSVN